MSSADLKPSALGLAVNGFTVFPVKPGDPIRFAEDTRLDGKSRHALTALVARAHHDAHVRGGDWLREVTGWDPKTIFRAIKTLEEANRI